MKRFFTFLTIICLFLGFCSEAEYACAEGIEVSSYAELASAVASAGMDTYIVLLSDISMEETIEIPSGATVILESVANAVTLRRAGYSGPMFTVPAGSSLTIKGSQNSRIALAGAGSLSMETDSSDSGIYAEGGVTAEYVDFSKFSGENGAAICLTDGDGSSGLVALQAHFCSFSDNRAQKGGALYIGFGRFAEITASVFTGNSALEKGDAAYVVGQLTYGSNNRITDAAGPMELGGDGVGFNYGQEIVGSGDFKLSYRTDVNGTVSWGGKGEIPSAIEVILLADGTETARKTVTPDAEGYWSFSFEDLPAEVTYDIAENPVEGYRFDKRGEADVGFEILYADVAAPEPSVKDLPPEKENPEQPVFEPSQSEEESGNPSIQNQAGESDNSSEEATEAPSASAEAPEPVVITKNPTDETAKAGGKVIFIAKADHNSGVVWHLISPDNTIDYAGEAIPEAFPNLEIEGLNEERLKLENISPSLSGWKARAEFTGAGGSVFSDAAVIHMENGEDNTTENQEVIPSPPPSATPEPTEEPLPTPYVPTPMPTVELVEVTPVPIEIVPQQDPSNTATPEPALRMVQVTALWNDNDNAYASRPPYVIVELYRDDTLYSTAVLNADSRWSYTFTQLSGGNYKVKEVAVEGYTLSYSALGNTVSILHTYNMVPQTPIPTLIPSTPYATPAVYTPAAAQTASAAPAPAVTPAASVQASEKPQESSTPLITPVPSASAGAVDVLPAKQSSFGLFVGALGVLGVIFVAAAVVLLRRPRK